MIIGCDANGTKEHDGNTFKLPKLPTTLCSYKDFNMDTVGKIDQDLVNFSAVPLKSYKP